MWFPDGAGTRYVRVVPRLRPSTLAALFLVLACDSTDKPKAADAKAADVKAADVEATALHLDPTHDKSGVLARSAAVIEISKAHDNENLRDLSHHAESLPSFEDVCKHEVEVGKSDVTVPDCIKVMEHHLVRIGPELYAEVAACIMAAKTPEQVAACDAAQLEVESALHTKPHGEGVGKVACEGLFTQFEKLAMEDAGDQATLVQEVLEEVKDDVIIACLEQGTQAEVDCAMKAKTMGELHDCASTLL